MSYLINFYQKTQINRSEFFVWNILISQIIPLTIIVIGFFAEWYRYAYVIAMLYALVIFILVFYSMSVVKRTRDTGIDMRWCILAFVPYVNTGYVIYLLFKRTKLG